MADVVQLDDRRPPVDEEVVKLLRELLSEAQNGRMVGIIAAYYDGEGSLVTRVSMDRATDAVAAAAALQRDMLEFISGDDE